MRTRERGKNNTCVGGEEGGRTVCLLDLQDGVVPSEGERKFRVRVENSLPIVVKHRDIPVRVVKFLALLPLMNCRVGCHRVA